MIESKYGELIKNNPSLIENELIERSKKLSTSLLCDAMDSFMNLSYNIRPVSPGMKLLGTAITVKVRPGDNLFLHKAIYLAGKGYVLVLDSSEHMTSAVWGEMMARAAIEKGIEGVVLDGAVRDLSVLRQLNIPVFSKGVIPNGMSRNGPGLINSTISCGGVSVSPGDLVMGDDDGVVIVPREKIDQVVSLAEMKLNQEEKRILEIIEGNLEPKWIAENISKLI